MVEGRLDLFWFTSTPDWSSRVLVTGLIGLIPIVGAINLLGWTLTAIDMVRGGWKELPPAGFQYLERGVAPFVVSLVYGVVLIAVLIVLTVVTVLVATSGRAYALLAFGLGLLTLLLVIAWWLLSLYLFAALLVGSDRFGFGKAVHPRTLFALARANHDVSQRVAVTYAVSSLAVFGIVIFIPFGSLLLILVLPVFYAILVPTVAGFRVEPVPLHASN